VVFLGAGVLHLTVEQFAMANVVLTLFWIGVALLVLNPNRAFPWLTLKPVAPAAVAALIVLGFAMPAQAQQTREELLAAEKAEKATQLHPYEPDRLEQRLQRAEKALFGAPHFYPFMGSAFPGGGVAVGPAYRTRYGDSGAFDAHAAWSVENYRAANAVLKLPTIGGGRVSVEADANWLNAPDVAFYGVGNNLLAEGRAGLAYRNTSIGVSTQLHASRYFAVGGGLDSMWVETGAAEASSVTFSKPTYRRTRLFAEFDSRTSPQYTRRGGLYRVEWSDYHQTNPGAQSFGRVDAEVRQFVPVLRENWVLAFRALASTTTTVTGQDVPFVLLPDLGGSHTLRGYPSWRFRDRNRIILTGEYRWTAGPFVDMALFIDAGKVTARAEDLDLNDFTKTYGIGMSLHTPVRTVTRIELAHTRDGASVLFSFSPSF
jgi:hypothetical protein